MKINTRSLATALVLGISAVSIPLLTGCAGDRYNRSTGEYIDDHSLESRVKHDLHENPVYKFNGVTVTAFKGTVQLGGFVFMNEQKSRAGDITKNVPGVRDVVNNIIVRDQDERRDWDRERRADRRYEDNNRRYASTNVPPNAPPPSDYADDRTITANVKSALRHDPVKLDDVEVNTYNGSVQLSGFVNTSDQKSRAGEVARQVSGVKDVANNITVKDKM